MKADQNIYTRRQLQNLVIPLLRKYNANRAMLFGSYARNEATEDSDIDLLIIGGESFEPTDVFALAEDLHLASGKSVDVFEMQEINKNTLLYNTIMREEVTIQ